MYRRTAGKSAGFSVRCIKNTSSAPLPGDGRNDDDPGIPLKSGTSTPDPNYEYTYWCIENVFFGSETDPAIRVTGTNDFGNSPIGNVSETILTISNKGAGTVNLQSITFGGSTAFSLINPPASLPVILAGVVNSGPGLPSLSIQVGFNPATAGPATGTMYLNYNDGYQYAVSLAGYAVTFTDATEVIPDCTPYNFVVQPDLMYKYTAEWDHLVTITSCHPDNTTVPYVPSYDTYLQVFTGCPGKTGTTCLTNDDMESDCTTGPLPA